MTALMLSNIQIKSDLLVDEKYKYLFSVEEVNKLVQQGMPFRDAYKQVGISIEDGSFTHQPQVTHTHEGSVGNLCNEQIAGMMEAVIQKFQFNKANIALSQLLS